MIKTCLRCNKSISKSHSNRKRCESCAKALRSRPQGTMTRKQIAQAKAMIGNFPRDEIAKKIGVSISNLKRSLHGVSIWFHNGKYKNRPELIKKVIAYYKNHTLEETKEKFDGNGISAKCIVDRPEYYGLPKTGKQIRWTSDQIVEAVKMAGLVSLKAQARFFNRPGANEGSIRSLLEKRFDNYTGLNGMAKNNAKEIADAGVKYLNPLGTSRSGRLVQFKHLILWVDLEKNLRPEAPESIRFAIQSMADFQRWIWKSKNPKPLILKMMKDRELYKQPVNHEPT